MSAVLTTLAGIFVVLGALLGVASAIAMHRQRDAISRINVFSPATGLGLPLIVTAAFLHRWAVAGFDGVDLFKTLVTIAALLVVSSVATNVIARAAYLSAAPVDPHTDPQDLARAPEPGSD